jgi:hypothetical protein
VYVSLTLSAIASIVVAAEGSWAGMAGGAACDNAMAAWHAIASIAFDVSRCTARPMRCRRVQSLFHSVQLNVNNPHFLIMQGRITKVLNMKPPEILGLLEEAAGTKMYEDKKKKALHTLEKKQVKVDEINKVRCGCMQRRGSSSVCRILNGSVRVDMTLTCQWKQSQAAAVQPHKSVRCSELPCCDHMLSVFL